MNVFLKQIPIKGFFFKYPVSDSKTTALEISSESMQELTRTEWIDVYQK